MKIAYCGYDFFSASLSKLLQAEHPVYRIITVPNRPGFNTNQYVKQIAQQYDLPVSEERITPQTIAELNKEGCELLICAAYNYKIPPLEDTNIKGINLHPTLLPQGRGEWPLPWTILTEQKQTGISVHKLTDEYDAGDILLQKAISVGDDETLETLSAKLQMLAPECLLESVSNIKELWNSAKPQSGKASHWPMPTREQRSIDWQWPVESIDRMCRAFGKFGCYATFDRQQWVVYQLKAWRQPHDFKPGDVVHKTSTEMIVAAADGLVSLLYFQKL